MALETFNFCPNSLVPETVPPEPTSVMSMNGWDFSQKPSVPYRRKFKVALHGMNWYLLANGLYDEVTDPTHNARLLEKFYQRHQLHAEFNWGHPHIGPLIVKFAAAVAVPAGVENSGGFVKAFEIQMVESNPSFD